MAENYKGLTQVKQTEEFEDLSWQKGALCLQTEPELFFPKRGESPNAAKKICATCDVGLECLHNALDHHQGESGIAGGMTEGERKKLVGKSRREVDRVFFEIEAINRRLR